MDANFIRRLIGILGLNQLLETKVADLENEVNKLISFTQSEFGKRGYKKKEPKFLKMEELQKKIRSQTLVRILYKTYINRWLISVAKTIC